MITEVWHDPENHEVRREPLYPQSPEQSVEIWVGTYPREIGQSVWVAYQQFDGEGKLIPDEQSRVINPADPLNPLRYVQCRWRYNNSDDNSYWCAIIGPFDVNTKRVIYNIFARQGTKVVTIGSPDFFEFSMARDISYREATGGPGITGAWTSGAKDGVSTAYSDLSHVWLSHSKGTINEIYFPHLDTPNIRDVQFLVLDTAGTFNDPKKMEYDVEYLDVALGLSPDTIPRSLGYRITNKDSGVDGNPKNRYELVYDVITDPTEHSVLVNMRYLPKNNDAKKFRIFAMINPSMGNSGKTDCCKFVHYKNTPMYLAWENGIYCAMAVNRPIPKYGCGFHGVNDGWKDLMANKDLTFGFTAALQGDVVGTVEISLPADSMTAILSISFGKDEEDALSRAYRTVMKDFTSVTNLFVSQWKEYLLDLETRGELKAITQNLSEDQRRLAYVSAMCIKSMEDKVYKGAIIASMSIPWGDCKDGYYGGYHDSNAGGYHLVWGRDLYNMATAAMAIGDHATAVNILHYFDKVLQETDGSMPQNTWIDGTPYWRGEQLDESAYPIILAWRLKKLGRINDQEVHSLYDSLVKPTADFLSRYEQTWTQDRWEEVVGRSPFTVATVVAGLAVASLWADERHDRTSSQTWKTKAVYFAENDLKDCYLERSGKKYFARIFNPWDGHFSKFMDVIDGGFLELVRLGVLSPTDPRIKSSIGVVDESIRKVLVEHSYYLRYGRVDKRDAEGKDTYGEQNTGYCWTGDGSGVGRVWPLLTGERGHFEIVNNNLPFAKQCLQAIVASTVGKGLMLPEQVWDAETIKRDEHGHPLYKGKGTKSATPLGWTHGEYLKLVRSLHDKAIFDLVPEVVQFCKDNNIYKP